MNKSVKAKDEVYLTYNWARKLKLDHLKSYEVYHVDKNFIFIWTEDKVKPVSHNGVRLAKEYIEMKEEKDIYEVSDGDQIYIRASMIDSNRYAIWKLNPTIPYTVEAAYDDGVDIKCLEGIVFIHDGDYTMEPEMIQKVDEKFYDPMMTKPEMLADIISSDSVEEAKAKLNGMKEALRYNQGKADWTLLPMDVLEGTVRVLEYGAHKYSVYEDDSGKQWKGSEISIELASKMKVISLGRDNWRKGFEWSGLVKSLLRHIIAMVFMREYKDKESGLPHIDHMFCNLLFLRWHIIYRRDLNDFFDNKDINQ